MHSPFVDVIEYSTLRPLYVWRVVTSSATKSAMKLMLLLGPPTKHWLVQGPKVHSAIQNTRQLRSAEQ